MTIRRIKGLSKAQFLERCMTIANEINPNWEREIFNCDNFVPSVVWNSSNDTHGFALSFVGGKFFEQALQLTPYYLEVQFLYSKDLINLNKRMPWPYTAGRFEGSLVTKIGIYSEAVAVWAALYDNDLNALLEAYSTK